MYAVTAAQSTVVSIFDILVKDLIPKWRFPESLQSDNGRHLSSELLRTLYKLMRMSKLITSAYQPRGNRGTERVNHPWRSYV